MEEKTYKLHDFDIQCGLREGFPYGAKVMMNGVDITPGCLGFFIDAGNPCEPAEITLVYRANVKTHGECVLKESKKKIKNGFGYSFNQFFPFLLPFLCAGLGFLFGRIL